jgi:hypothetical protein
MLALGAAADEQRLHDGRRGGGEQEWAKPRPAARRGQGEGHRVHEGLLAIDRSCRPRFAAAALLRTGEEGNRVPRTAPRLRCGARRGTGKCCAVLRGRERLSALRRLPLSRRHTLPPHWRPLPPVGGVGSRRPQSRLLGCSAGSRRSAGNLFHSLRVGSMLRGGEHGPGNPLGESTIFGQPQP